MYGIAPNHESSDIIDHIRRRNILRQIGCDHLALRFPNNAASATDNKNNNTNTNTAITTKTPVCIGQLHLADRADWKGLPGAPILAELAGYERTQPETQSLKLIASIQSSSAVPVAIPSAKENMSPSLMSAPADDQAMLERNYRQMVPANAASGTGIPEFHIPGWNFPATSRPYARVTRPDAPVADTNI